MTVEKVEHKQGVSTFFIHEPRRYGEPDGYFEVNVSHDSDELAKLPTMTTKEISKLGSEGYGTFIEVVDSYHDLPAGETIIFKRVYDNDYSSATHRHGSHQIKGPYLLVKETK